MRMLRELREGGGRVCGATPFGLGLINRGSGCGWGRVGGSLDASSSTQHSSLTHTQTVASNTLCRSSGADHWAPHVGPRPRQRLDLVHLGRGVRGVRPHLPPPDLPPGPHGRVKL